MTTPLPLWAEDLVVFDTETTGVNTAQARIVSSTIAVLHQAEHVVERYDWLIDPGIEIPEQASQIHGITTDIARESGIQSPFGIAQIVEKLNEMIDRGLSIVVYNAPYDLTLLKNEASRHGVTFLKNIAPIIDPLVIDKYCDKFRKGKRTLEVVAEHYGVPLVTAHDAGEDAIAAGKVAALLAQRYEHLLPSDAMELHHAQVRWAAEQAESFADYMRRSGKPDFVANTHWPVHETP